MNVLNDYLDDPLDAPLESVIIPQSITLGNPVPNVFPKITNVPYRIAIIGNYPSRDDELQGLPFCGQAGRNLSNLLSKANILREACFLGNIWQHPSTQMSADLKAQHEAQLSLDLAKFKPNICVLLGKETLFALTGNVGLDNWRGSLIRSTQGLKCIASYHPVDCNKVFEYNTLLLFDLFKAKEQSLSPYLVLPERDLQIDLSFEETIAKLDDILCRKPRISQDIEGYVGAMTCCCISETKDKAFIIPFAKLDGSSYWPTVDQETQIWLRFRKIQMDPKIKKIWQNGLYDRFVIQYSYGIPIFGNLHDTMLSWWEKYCELEKGLGFQCSILTEEPYYKFERKVSDYRTHYTYCCRDGCVTNEIADKSIARLLPKQLEHYRFNHDLLNPLLYMELKGIRYNTTLAKERLKEINSAIYELQGQLDLIAGFGVIPTSPTEVLQIIVQESMCFKKDKSTPKKDFVDTYPIAWSLACRGNLTKAECGQFNILTSRSMNIKSDAFKNYLYKTLGLPKQYHPKTKELTTDYLSLLKIQKLQPHRAVELALELGELRTRSQMLEIHADEDGRIRCGYNIVGTETGRITCYTSPTGSGYNLQTIPDTNKLKPIGHPLREGLRNLFQADEDHWMFQCDLSGADGWTVGAHLAALGDNTMLEDLKSGIKPASAVCYMFRRGNSSLIGKPREEQKELLKEVNKEDWDYFMSKQGIWMTCYLGGPIKLQQLILIQSEGKFNLALSDVKRFQEAVHSRYHIRIWHKWMERHLEKSPELTAFNGFRRRFYGRRTEILGQALSHEPQVNTTYSTNMAAHKLWTDKENRNGNKLVIQPLHQVHDALIGQFHKDKLDWAKTKIRSWFNNPITIAGTTLVIPFEGNYGESWGNLGEGKI